MVSTTGPIIRETGREWMMVKIKEMPYSEKYTNMIDRMKLFDWFVPPFVQQHLGDQAVGELQGFGGKGSNQFPKMLHLKTSMR